MKRIIASVAALGCTLSSVAQQPAEYEYVPMVREGVEWEYYAWDMSYSEIIKFHFDGEKTINGKTYKRCYRTSNKDDFSTQTLAGYMREDNRKVYSIAIDSKHYGMPWDIYGKEYLSYNFDYDNTGDTETIMAFRNDIIEYIVSDISFMTINDKPRRKIKFGTTVPALIEGLGYMGNQHGSLITPQPLLLSCSDCYRAELIAVRDTKNGVTEWKKENYDTYIEWAGTGDVESGSDGLQVMQGDGWLRIKVDCNCYRRAELTDAKGTVVDTVTLQGESEAEFTTEWLPAGVYVVSLISDTGIRSAKVIIK